MVVRIAVLLWLLLLAACELGAGADQATGPSEEAGFHHPQKCGECHPSHAADWEISSHAYAIKDPVFTAMVRLGQQETEGALEDFCLKCHSPIAVKTGQARVRRASDGHWEQPLQELDRVARAGVSCDACHTMTVVHTTANADYELEGDGVRRGPIRDAMDNDFHESRYSGLIENSRMCGSCHQVVSQLFTESVALEETFGEWLGSPFNGTSSCQSCHMESYEGRAAVGGPMREVHRHTFVGVDVSLVEPDEFPGYERGRALVQELLQQSAILEASFDAELAALDVSIENLAGHSLPSGATADREMWLELIVRDGQGAVVFESGTLDERGDLRDDNEHHTTRPGTDPQLVVYRQIMLFDPSLEDPSSTEPVRPVDFLWEPNDETSHLIRPGAFSRFSYDLSELPVGDYELTLRLLFRSFSMHLLRTLEERAELDPAIKDRVPTVEMQSLALSIQR